MDPTPSLLKRAAREWSAIAGHDVRVELICQTLYALTSELGALRLAHRMRCGRAEWSANRGTWFYARDLTL